MKPELLVVVLLFAAIETVMRTWSGGRSDKANQNKIHLNCESAIESCIIIMYINSFATKTIRKLIPSIQPIISCLTTTDQGGPAGRRTVIDGITRRIAAGVHAWKHAFASFDGCSIGFSSSSLRTAANTWNDLWNTALNYFSKCSTNWNYRGAANLLPIWINSMNGGLCI